MNYGKRYLIGKGCEETNNGRHIVEVEEGQLSIWCCYCAREFWLCYKCIDSLYKIAKVNKCCKDLLNTEGEE